MIAVPALISGLVTYAVARAMGPNAPMADKACVAIPIGLFVGAFLGLIL